MPSTVCPLNFAVMSIRAVRASASKAPTTADISISAPRSSSGTTTGRVKRTSNSRTIPGSPSQSVTTRPAEAMVNIPCAITSGRPTSPATRSFQ